MYYLFFRGYEINRGEFITKAKYCQALVYSLIFVSKTNF